MDSSSDLEPLWAEIKAARDVLHHVQDVQRRGQLNDTAVTIVSEVTHKRISDRFTSILKTSQP